MTARLRRAQRIRKRAEFVRIQDSSSRVTTRHLLFLLAARREAGPTRLGVVASRKVGCAVARNRAKRLARETFRLHQNALPFGIDLVVIVRPGTHLLGLKDLEGEFASVMALLHRRARDVLRSNARESAPGSTAAAPEGSLRDRSR